MQYSVSNVETSPRQGWDGQWTDETVPKDRDGRLCNPDSNTRTFQFHHEEGKNIWYMQVHVKMLNLESRHLIEFNSNSSSRIQIDEEPLEWIFQQSIVSKLLSNPFIYHFPKSSHIHILRHFRNVGIDILCALTTTKSFWTRFGNEYV